MKYSKSVKGKKYMSKRLSTLVVATVIAAQVTSVAEPVLANVVDDVQATMQEGNQVYKAGLEIAVSEAYKITEDNLINVVPVVIEEFRAALAEAESVLANLEATQEDVDNAFNRLSNALHMLEHKGDKTEFNNLINTINSLDSNKYTEASWRELQNALTNPSVTDVINNNNALQADINNAYDIIKAAYDALEEKEEVEVDKSKLKEDIDIAESLDEKEYTESSWGKLEKALKDALEVYNNSNATQAEVDKAEENLEKAISELKKVDVEIKVDKSDLKDAIDSADGLNKKDYTENTWKKVEHALKEAKKVYANDKATQKEVDDAEKALREAIKNLDKVNVPVEPEDDKDDLPSTGGTSAVAVGLLGSLLAGVGSLLSKKRK